MIPVSRALTEAIDLIASLGRLIHKPERFKLIGKLSSSQKLEAKLFRRLQKGMDLGDFEVASALGLNYRTRKDRDTFSVALSHLKSSILDHLFFLDLSQNSVYSRQSYKLELNIARIRIMSFLAGHRVACVYARRALKEALELEEWLHVLTLLSILRNGAALAGNSKSYNNYNKSYRDAKALLDTLEQVDQAIDNVYLIFSKSNAEHPEVVKAIDGALHNLLQTSNITSTFKLQEGILRLKRIRAQALMNYEESSLTATMLEKLLNKYPLFDNKTKRAECAKVRLIAGVQTMDYDTAKKARIDCEKYHTIGNNNWFYYKEWDFILHMHLKEYAHAKDILNSVIDNQRFSSQLEPQHEKWYLFSLYVDFFLDRELPKRFEQILSKRSTSFKHDYEGYKVAAMILVILDNLKAGKYAAIENSIERLAKYRQRNLSKRESNQSNLFLHLLQSIPALKFNPKMIAVKSKPFLKKLERIRTIDLIQSQQVIPYMALWSHIELLLKLTTRTKYLE